ncbi:MAG: AAA family ATPase, partial [Myxococcales bacterium]|nr:AAA family ATPase [Myxococcales bacterium]
MLRKLRVQGFKSLRDLSVEFGRFSVLVGANGCGKSSVLQAIMLLRDVGASTYELPPFAHYLSRTQTGPLSQIHFECTC